MFIDTRNNHYRVKAGRTYFGTCATLKEAFALLKSHGLDKVVRSAPQRDVEVFKCVFPLFRDWRPVDYNTLVDMDRELAGMVVSRCLSMFMIWGKETEWRQQLTKVQKSFKTDERLLLQQLLSHHKARASAAGKLIWESLQPGSAVGVSM